MDIVAHPWIVNTAMASEAEAREEFARRALKNKQLAEKAAQEAILKQALLQADNTDSSSTRRSSPRIIQADDLQVKEFDLDTDQSVGSTFFTNYSALYLYNLLLGQLDAKGFQIQ